MFNVKLIALLNGSKKREGKKKQPAVIISQNL